MSERVLVKCEICGREYDKEYSTAEFCIINEPVPWKRIIFLEDGPFHYSGISKKYAKFNDVCEECFNVIYDFIEARKEANK